MGVDGLMSEANSDLLSSKRFPRASAYNPAWLLASVSGGANSLWLTEWLCEAMPLERGMRVLDLGCGLAASSIFLHRELGVQVWATDLWFSASDNLRRIEDAGAGSGVFPIHADARMLPFANGFFDAVVSIDSFVYYGTDDHYLGYLARLLKPGGLLGIAGAGLVREIEGDLPDHLKEWWEPGMWCLHSPAWWKQHWERTGIVRVETADMMEDGWKRWLDWQRVVAPDNEREMRAIESDAGRYMGYVRVVARRRPDAVIDEPVVSIPTEYARVELLRDAIGSSRSRT